ncbi:MAG: hypothetical protein ABIP13_10115 [Tepidiformaceae bacterium]
MDTGCLLVPNFAIALARRDNPQLRGRAVVVGGSPEEYAAVTACSEEAAASGVTIGATLRRALALCPSAVFLPLQDAAVNAEASHLVDLLRLYSPTVEAIAPGHIHTDLRGLARMAGMEEISYLEDLQEAACSTSGLAVQLGAAETVFAAHAAAWTASGGGLQPIHRGDARLFLGGLPLDVLPVSPQMHERLRLFGLERLEQVAALPFSAIQAQFGREGAHAWALANGRDASVVVARREELRISGELELPAPTSVSGPLVAGTQMLLQRTLAHKELRGQSLRRLDWWLGLESGEQITRRFIFREPTNDPARMLFVVKNKIERLQLPSAAVSLGLTLSGLCSEYGHQGNLWQAGPRRRKELLDAIEQLNAREGEPQVFQIVEVQPWSRIPERQLALVAYGG